MAQHQRRQAPREQAVKADEGDEYAEKLHAGVRIQPTPSNPINKTNYGVYRYYETIDMLYQQNTFYIEHPYTLTELCKYMPQERLSSFRTLSLEFAIARFQPLPLPERRDIVRALKMLDGLECLCLIMRLPCDVVTQMRPLERLIKRATARGCFAVAPRLLWAPILGVMGKREKSVKECPLHGIHLSDPKAIELGSFCE